MDWLAHRTFSVIWIVSGQPGGGTEENNIVIVSNKLGLNPTLNKQLKASVSAVSPKVVAVRKSFEAVGGIVERFSVERKDAPTIAQLEIDRGGGSFEIEAIFRRSYSFRIYRTILHSSRSPVILRSMVQR